MEESFRISVRISIVAAVAILTPVLRGLKRPLMIMWIGLYRQVAAPFAVFPLLAYTLGMEVNGVFWGLAIVNWSAAVFTFWWSRRNLAQCQAKAEKEATAAG